MSQIIAHRVDTSKILLLQDLHFIKKGTSVRSAAKEPVCVICDKGLGEAVSVTAKKVGQKMRFFCQCHLPKDL